MNKLATKRRLPEEGSQQAGIHGMCFASIRYTESSLGKETVQQEV